ncbi:hypothetical protein PMIN04_009923 [Paraphaeosphaeria minitans]
MPNSTSPCLSYAEKQIAVQADAYEVSGWYGPGAYLAWLFTLYVSSLSSIWHANYNNHSDAVRKQDKFDNDAIDGEFLAVLAYPTVAILDLLHRFIRCKVDPTLDAAMLVILIGTFTMCTARRFASLPDLDKWVDGDYFPSGSRQWMLSIFLQLGHSLNCETLAEPYVSGGFTITVYALLLLNILHSCIKVERLRDRYPYRFFEKRPRVKRLVMFVLLQMAFWLGLGVTRKSVFPRTGASLLDLDQCATLVTVIVATIFARRTRVLDWLKHVWLRFSGFRLVQPHPVEVFHL